MARNSSWEHEKERWEQFYEEYFNELQEAIGQGDAPVVRKAAHRLLGHLRMLDAAVLPGILQDMLTAAHAGDLDGILLEWKEYERKEQEFRRELARA
jgi:HPt (histidine-containing phosphotransfer) domain-containing protein